MYDHSAVQSASASALAAYKRWSNSGFWAGFFEIESKSPRENAIKLPSRTLRHLMTNALWPSGEKPDSKEFEARFVFMDAVLEQARAEEMNLLKQHYRLRFRGQMMRFLMTVFLIGIVTALGLTENHFAMIAAVMIALSSCCAYYYAMAVYQRTFARIAAEASDIGDQNSVLLWRQAE